ncbi:stemmadenine O-acetyltransferase-like [Juglans microcarpa x Juglans regia]|uniref:stemmadenine O-acetyltransferase-like n=1 Tax=Juglans microcarpa x Juglans regia TaxID=2249226 RepID=UPI001B7EBCDC|nr:stemmadenine O-acetyltransferase-like [Juglans microcarpa x Juglans regia]
MEGVKVNVKAREIIKPSSPTSQNLKIFKLSLLDQIAPPLYVPWIFYYAIPSTGRKESNAIETRERINHLKQSLSQALTRISPLAGRVKDNLFIECNDEGADFSEAEVNCPLSEILRRPEVGVLDQLLPRDYRCSNPSMELMQLAIQVNIFSCEGMAIGICALHKLVDGATLSFFVNMWGAINASGGSAGDSFTPFFPGSQLFPPRNLSVPRFEIPKAKCITKRFLFPASKIAALKERVLLASKTDIIFSPTRIEVVTLPESASGNLSWLAIAPAPAPATEKSLIELQDLVKQIRNAIKTIDKDYAREMQGENGFSLMSECLKQVGDLVPEKVEVFRFISWAKFRLHEADFGWGKPIWVSTAGSAFKNTIVFIEKLTGDDHDHGIEAWVSMDEQDMSIFENNQDLCSFVSLH